MKKNLPRFLYGFLSSSVEPINMALPWRPSDRDGLFKMNRLPEDAERDSLILWAHTNKGERVYDFDFGLDAHRYLFEPEPLVKDVLQNNGRIQLKKYFPHIIVDRFEILTKGEDETLQSNSVRVILIARIKNSGKAVEINEVLA